ncbi:MAG: MFS transporter [Hyphomicrobiales bacterium]|nr:MFS transporter [Hyphomicrobiales bacterium]MCY4049346.1 MFS transporter [Hyphomicrobiales bacterium]MCY4053510.1 MFS transporter [Hyphomicrobiales bacterium]
MQIHRPLLIIVTTCCLAYIISQFLRNSIGVIAPDLAGDFGLEPSDLGLLSGVFFLSFGCVQLPLGICLDRFGARLTVSLGLLLAALSCGLFAIAQNFENMMLARIFMGIGCSPLLMGPMLLYSRWFARERFASITGFHMAIGGLGTISATAPLAFATATIGWRNSFWCFAILSILVAWTVYAFIRDAPEGHTPHPKESWGQALQGLREVLLHPDVKKLLPLNITGYACFVTLLGLWFSPYLADVHGFGLEARGDALLLVSFVHTCAILLWSNADVWMNSRRIPVLIGTSVSVAVMLTLAILPGPSSTTVIALFVAQGIFAGYMPALLAHGRSLFPDRLTGRGITLFNMMNILGVFLLQSLSGFILQFFLPHPDAATPESAYRGIFAMLALLLAASGAAYACAQDRRPRETPSG